MFSWPPTSDCDRLASPRSFVTRSASLSGPCSAWARRSPATRPGSAVPSATTTTSLGPAGKSMRTRLETRSFAAVTYALPGPTIGIDGSDRLRAVRERRHGLRAADRVELVDPELARGDEDRIGRLRRHDRDASDAGDERRDRGHDERRRQRRPTTRDAEPHCVEREPPALGHDAGRSLDRRVTRALRLAEGPDRLDHPSERLELVGAIDAPPIRSASTRIPSGRGPSKCSVHSHQRDVPTLTDVRDDRADGSRASRRERRPHGTSLSTGSDKDRRRPRLLERRQECPDVVRVDRGVDRDLAFLGELEDGRRAHARGGLCESRGGRRRSRSASRTAGVVRRRPRRA